MGTTLQGTTPGGEASTFKWLLHIGNATLATPRRVSTGDGLDTGLVIGSNSVGVANAGGFQATLDPSGLTASRSFTLPNSSGTLALLSDLDGKAATSHTHPASQISDSTATGRAVLTAATQSDARTTGLGSGATGDALFTAVDLAAARQTLGVIRRVLSSDALATSTTPVAAPDLTFPVEAGKAYRVDLSLVVASAAGASPNNPGYQVSMTYPNNARTGFGQGMLAHATTVKIPNVASIFAGLNPNTTGNPNGTTGVSGFVYLRPTVSGNVTFASYHQTAAQTGSVGLLAGSLVIVTEL